MLIIGTSGWQYDEWRGDFYPRELPKRAWLEYYAERFPTLESNNAFYRLPERKTFSEWRDRTPDGFVFAVKVSRYLTHIKRLRDPTEPVARFLDRAAGLGPKLGPVLLQLPPTLQADPDLLATTLRQFPSTVDVAVEPRHKSWWTAEIRAVLEHHHAALCWADRDSRPVTPLWRTTGFGYLRLHHGASLTWSRYGHTALHSWLTRLTTTFTANEPVYVYFNNDPAGAAIQDAIAFTHLAQQEKQELAIAHTAARH